MKNRHIAIGAIFTALIIVLISLSYVIPGIELLFILFLPFLSSYVSLEFGFKKSLPFLISSLILSFLVSYTIAILYVFPSLVSGMCFGILSRKIRKIGDLTFIMSFIEGALFALSIITISSLFNMNIDKDISSLLNIKIATFNENLYLYLFLIGVTQASLTSITLVYNFEKLNIKEFEYSSGIIIFIANLISILIMMIFYKNPSIIKLGYGIYFVTLLAQVLSSFKLQIKYNWIIIVIQIITLLFISIPVLTIISDSLKLFVYSWFLWPLVVKNCIQVFNFKR